MLEQMQDHMQEYMFRPKQPPRWFHVTFCSSLLVLLCDTLIPTAIISNFAKCRPRPIREHAGADSGFLQRVLGLQAKKECVGVGVGVDGWVGGGGGVQEGIQL